MSQMYRVKVSASVKETITDKDKQKKTLKLTEVVAADEQKEILKERLKERGWTEEEGSDGKRWTREKDGVTETIDLDDMTVEAEVEVSKKIEREKTKEVTGDLDFGTQDTIRQRGQQEVEREVEITDAERSSVRDTIVREASQKLADTEEERNREINEVVREVYAESLKRKAGRLGSVTEVREGRDGNDYEMVIKVKQ